MKPLARWTIGKVSKTGHEILKESIISFKKIYPEFDYTVCYNEIELEDLETLENVSYFQQTHDCCNIQVKPFSINAWKLFPPRLRINSHEIFLDNDIVIHKRIPQIDKFLQSNKPLCYGCNDMRINKHRRLPYGAFSSFFSIYNPASIKHREIAQAVEGSFTHNKKSKKFILNSGIFGLPPNYEFEHEIIKFLKEANLKKWEYFDEQGLVAKCLLNKDPIFINDIEISNCWLDYKHGKYGCHFCEHNSTKRIPWEKYKNIRINNKDQ